MRTNRWSLIKSPWVLVASIVWFAHAASAACPGSCAIPGGGGTGTDCFAELDGVTPNVPAANPVGVRCIDGDPSCDSDGAVNGACRFALSVCFGNADPRFPRCTAPAIDSFTVRNGRAGSKRFDPQLEQLAAAATAAISKPGTCASSVPIYVPLRGKRAYRSTNKIVHTLARTATGRRDADTVRLRCLPSPEQPKPTSTYSVARTITQPAELIGGPLSRGRLGDTLLANDKIQVVIQHPERSMFGIGTYGGNIIDADLQRPTGEERDSFEEIIPQINLENTAHYTAVQVLNDGANGQPAVVRATGPDDLFDFINASSVVAGQGFTFPAAADDRDLPVDVTTDYSLAPGARAVRIDTTLTNTGDAPLDIFLGDYLNGSGQIELFQPTYGFGEPLVTQPCPAATKSACAGGLCDLCDYIAYSGEDEADGVSYGYLHLIDGSSTFSVSGVTAELFANQVLFVLVGIAQPNYHLAAGGSSGDSITVTRYFAVGDGSVASLLDVRNSLRTVTVGTLSGQVTAGGAPVARADVAVLAAPFSGGPSNNVVNHFRTDDDGRYAGTLPIGSYTVRANQDGRLFGTPDPAPITITAGASTTQNFTLPLPGSLHVTVTDEHGQPVPAKVQLIGFDASPDPYAIQDIAGVIHNVTGVFGERREDGLPYGIAGVFFADKDGDTGVVAMEPGTYQVAVSRGGRYSLFTKDVTITAGQVTTVAAQIARVVDTPGFIAGDFHLHALESPDSEVTHVERVATQLAEGVDFFTPSEHDIRIDYAPVITAMGVGDLIATAPSAEITTFDYGHFNSWPVTVDPTQTNGGSVDWGRAGIAPGADFPALGSYNLSPGEIYAAAHADPKPNLIQINHMDSFFNAGGLDIDTAEGNTGPPQSHVDPAARRLDPSVANFFDTNFDALEIWNGSQPIFLGENFGDWVNMLNQGIVRSAVADSDTHERRTNGGAVRTYIASTVTAPASLSAVADTTAATIVAGKVSGTNSLFVSSALHAVSTGDAAALTIGTPSMVATTDGAVDLTLTVSSPLWAEFDRVELYLNAATDRYDHDDNVATRMRYRAVPDMTLNAGTDFVIDTVTDFPDIPGAGHRQATITVPLTGLTEDTWVVALVRGTPGTSRPLFPVLPGIDPTNNTTVAQLTDGNLGEGGETALAFTNPLFIDADHNGVWTPPGVRLTPP